MIAPFFVRRIVLCHPIRCGLAQTFGVFVDDRLLVVEGLRIVDHSLGVAFDLAKTGVLAIF